MWKWGVMGGHGDGLMNAGGARGLGSRCGRADGAFLLYCGGTDSTRLWWSCR